MVHQRHRESNDHDEFDQVIATVQTNHPVIIEQGGKAIAAVVSIDDFERWKRRDELARQRLTAFYADLPDSGLTDDAAMEIAIEAQRAVREERARRTA